MSYIHGKEMEKFKKSWKKEEEKMRAAGMSEEAIQEMFEYDYEEFKKQRCYKMHEVSLEENMEDVEQIPAEDSMMTTDWMDSIEDERIYDALQECSAMELEIIKLIAIEGYSEVETAEILGVNRKTVYRCMRKIRTSLESIYAERCKKEE